MTLLLKDIFVYLKVWIDSTLKYSQHFKSVFHFLLASIIYNEKSAVRKTAVPL